MLETHLRQAATVVLESAIRIAPPDTREWGQAMRGELNYVRGPWAALGWALGGASVLAKGALAALLIPGRRGQGLAPDGVLFARTVSLRKAALIAGGACVLGALLFLLAPPFRQGIRVSLAVWRGVFPATTARAQPGLTALARRAETQHDPEGLAFCAVRHRKSRESARLAEKALQFDPSLVWVYAVVAVRHPELPEIRQWLPELERWDPQNALFHFIAAESRDIEIIGKASRLTPQEEQKQLQEDPTRQSALAAAFASPKFDDYRGRLQELARSVVSRYGFNDPFEALTGEDSGLPTYAFSDSQQFARSLLESGEKLEARGDRKGASEKYWVVARFGQMIDSQAHTDSQHSLGSGLQAGAYKQLQRLYANEGNPDEAALFGYLVGKFDAAAEEHARLSEQWVFGQYVSRRNAAFLQLSGLLMLLFSGLVVTATSVAMVGGRRGARPGAQRARPVATVVALASAVGLLLSSATLYLTYRPYWYIAQRAILNGDRSRTSDLNDFLAAAQMPPGFDYHDYLSMKFPIYFWTGVTLLGVIALALILLRHLPGPPRARASL